MSKRKRSPFAFMLPLVIPFVGFIGIIIIICALFGGGGYSNSGMVTMSHMPSDMYQVAYDQHCIEQYPSMGELLAYEIAYLGYNWTDHSPQIIQDVAQKARSAKANGQTFDFEEAVGNTSHLYDFAYEQMSRLTGNLVGYYKVEEDVEVEEEVPAPSPSPAPSGSPAPSATPSPSSSPVPSTPPSGNTPESSNTTGSTIKVTRIEHRQYDVYGVKSYYPIPRKAIDSNKNVVEEFSVNHINDFGDTRTFGGERYHEGNDLMAPEGTPIIAVEEGTIERMGWGMLGGYNIIIQSYDGQRKYYYAHMYKEHPFAEGLAEGSPVTAGQVIGFVGKTGYSPFKGTNGPFEPHLHFQVGYVDPEDSDTVYVDPYPLLQFLYNNKRAVLIYNGQYNYTLDIHIE